MLDRPGSGRDGEMRASPLNRNLFSGIQNGMRTLGSRRSPDDGMDVSEREWTTRNYRSLRTGVMKRFGLSTAGV